MNDAAKQAPASSEDVAQALSASPKLPLMSSILGLLMAQFLGAFNDNFFKIVISLFAVSAVAHTDHSGRILSLIGAIFILPFLLFSGYAGHLADVHSKRQVLIATKILEVVTMVLGFVAFLSEQFSFMLAVLFLLALQSTFFSPAKYGILPEGQFFWKWPQRFPYPVTVPFGAQLPSTTKAETVRQLIGELGSAAVDHRRTRRDLLHLRFIMVFVEDILPHISSVQKMWAGLVAFLAPTRLLQALYHQREQTPQSLVTVVFSSGSTGVPKGVMLSHHNVLSNVEAIQQVFSTRKDDCVMGVLPLFHSFGFKGKIWH